MWHHSYMTCATSLVPNTHMARATILVTNRQMTCATSLVPNTHMTSATTLVHNTWMSYDVICQCQHSGWHSWFTIYLVSDSPHSLVMVGLALWLTLVKSYMTCATIFQSLTLICHVSSYMTCATIFQSSALLCHVTSCNLLGPSQTDDKCDLSCT